MINLLSALGSLLSFRVRRPLTLELELVALRHQLTVRAGNAAAGLGSSPPTGCSGSGFTGSGRGFSTPWSWSNRQPSSSGIVKASASTGGGARVPWDGPVNREVSELIRQMSQANPLWGAPRIHGELIKLGIEVSQATVGRYLPWRPKAPSPTWRSFLHNHMPDTAAIDMFVVVTATFQLLYALVVLDHQRRTVIHFNITPNPTQSWLARQITEAFP